MERQRTRKNHILQLTRMEEAFTATGSMISPVTFQLLLKKTRTKKLKSLSISIVSLLFEAGTPRCLKLLYALSISDIVPCRKPHGEHGEIEKMSAAVISGGQTFTDR